MTSRDISMAAAGNSGVFTSWTRRTAVPLSGTPSGYLLYDGTKFVATVGTGVYISTNSGASWSSYSSGVASTKHSIWTGSLFVAVGNAGDITTSSNGTVWTARTSGDTGNLYGVAWSSSLGRYVAVGVNATYTAATVLTSPDAIAWTSQTAAGASAGFKSVAWSPSLSLFTAVGPSGVIMTSPDGITWTSRTSGVSAQLNRVIWSSVASLFIAVGTSATLITSPDGINWTARTSGALSTLFISDVKEIGATLVAVGGAYIATSTDGVNWTVRSGDEGASFNSVAGSSTDALAIGDTGVYTQARSPNLTSWTVYSDDRAFNCMTWTGTKFLAACGYGLYTSSDGITWTFLSKIPAVFNGVIWSPTLSMYFGGAAVGIIYTSPDGLTWTARSTGSSGTFNAFAVNGSTIVAVGTGGVVYTSTTGTSWTVRTSGTTNALQAVTYSSLLAAFVAVGANGTIITSSTGSSWVVRTSGTTNGLLGVVASSTEVVAAGSSGTVVRSTAISTWTAGSVGSSNSLLSIARAGAYFVTAGSGFRYTSLNGLTWDAQTVAGLYASALAYSGSLLAASGTSHKIYTTTL